MDLFYQEEYGKAAIAFGKLGDFRDAREISFKIWDAIAVRNTFSTGNTDAVAIKNNGAVISTSPGRNTRICESDNIISVRAAGSSVAIGLKADGTVVLDKPEWYHLSVDISDWNNIVSVSLDDWHVVGLRADGTVVAAGWYEETDDTHVGMCDVSDWTDIIAVEAGNGFTVALKADGTVIKTGDDIQGVYEISKWTDVVAIDAGWNHIVALKEDGTVVAVGLDSTGECDVSDWTDIVSICAGDDHTIGIKADGTVVGVGHKGERRYKVTDWKNITAVSIGWNILAGLQSDGTVVTAGRSRDMINNWQDIKLPADRDALLSRIKPQHISPEKVPDPVPAGLSAEETAYNEAVDLFYQEEYGKAAIAFGKLGDFRDAREISFKIWDAIAKRQTILADVACTMAIKEDGTVIACGAEAPEDMSEWKDIVSIASPPIGSYFPKAALRSDGRVMVYNKPHHRPGWLDRYRGHRMCWLSSGGPEIRRHSGIHKPGVPQSRLLGQGGRGDRVPGKNCISYGYCGIWRRSCEICGRHRDGGL